MHTKHFILTGTLAFLAFVLIVLGAYQRAPKNEGNITNEFGERVEVGESFGDQSIEERGGVVTGRRGLPPQDPETSVGKIKANVFTGTLETVDVGCFADGECFIEVDGKHVTALTGWSQETVGTIQGVDGFGNLENYIGKDVEIYAQEKVDGTYTLYGSEDFYIKLMDTDLSGGTRGGEAEPQIVRDGCMTGGCSGQLCVDAKTGGDQMTTCEYRAEYACYQTAMCERQTSGQCGWTETEDLLACIQDAGFEVM